MLQTLNTEDVPSNKHLPAINRPETILGIVISFAILANFAIFLRLYVRIRAKLLGWDDLFVVLAGVAVTIGSILTCLMPENGLGKHFFTLTNEHRMEYFKHIWSTNTAYTASTTFIKLSLLLQYLRLFDISSRKLPTILTRGMIVIVALWGTTFFLLALFSCRPIAKNWNYMLPGTCVAWGSKDPKVFFATFAAHAATNMLFDILVFMLPTPFLRDLRMQGKTRLGLVALFTVGAVVVTLSIARVVSLCLKRAGTFPKFDPSYATPSIYIFSVLEVNIAIICASIPIFWPLVTTFSLNQIFVVNEIEVRSDRRASAPGVGGAPVGIPLFDVEMGKSVKRASAVLVYGKEIGSKERDDDMDFACKETVKRPNRAMSKSKGRHLHSESKQSNFSTFSTVSGGQKVSIELGRRFSQDSQTGLNANKPARSRSDATRSGSEASASLERPHLLALEKGYKKGRRAG